MEESQEPGNDGNSEGKDNGNGTYIYQSKRFCDPDDDIDITFRFMSIMRRGVRLMHGGIREWEDMSHKEEGVGDLIRCSYGVQ